MKSTVSICSAIRQKGRRLLCKPNVVQAFLRVVTLLQVASGSQVVAAAVTLPEGAQEPATAAAQHAQR